MKNEERREYMNSLPKHLTYEPVAEINIAGRLVGKGHPVFIIAEAGANHHGDIANALKLIDVAAEAGADAIKFQHLTHDKIAADTPITLEWHGKQNWKTFSEFYKSSEMPYSWTKELVAHAKKRNIVFFSTPFDKEAVDVLDEAGVPVFKIASYELTDDVLLRYVAKKGKPIILSTGMSYLEEVAHAVRVIQEEGNTQIIVLHCVSIYPPKDPGDFNLKAIQSLEGALKLPIGYSDHAVPPHAAVAVAAVALGACVLEKHITQSQTGGSHDDPNSITPEDFKRWVAEVKIAELAISGSGIRQPVSKLEHEVGNDEVIDRWAQRSLYARVDIAKGTVIDEDMIITLRPKGGIHPRDVGIIIGKKTSRDIKARQAIVWDDFFPS